MKRLAIIGSGELGQQIAHHVISDKQFKVVGFFDDFRDKGDIINSLPVLGTIKSVIQTFEEGLYDLILIAIGYNHMDFRSRLFHQFKNKIPFARFIHSSCIVDSSCAIEEGVVIYPGCIIDKNVYIKENTLINLGSCIAHDTIIGSNSFLAPRVAIAGFVNVGESCILGINSTIIDNIRIADNTQLGGGSVVIKNIDKSGLYVGNPVRFIK